MIWSYYKSYLVGILFFNIISFWGKGNIPKMPPFQQIKRSIKLFKYVKFAPGPTWPIFALHTHQNFLTEIFQTKRWWIDIIQDITKYFTVIYRLSNIFFNMLIVFLMETFLWVWKVQLFKWYFTIHESCFKISCFPRPW